MRRLINIVRAEWSYCLSRFGIVRVRHLPTFVSVEPANFCQLSCPECPVGQRHGKSLKENRQMSMDIFRRVLSEVSPAAHTMQFYFQGEPLLNKHLPEMIALAHGQGLYTIVSTNAQALTPDLAKALTEAGLSKIIVSIDGFSQASYAAYRQGGNLQKALDGLRYLRQAKSHRHPRIELQVLRLKSNEQEWTWIRHHFRELGADCLSMKTAQFYDFEHGNPLMPSDERYCRYRKGEDGLYHLKRKVQRHFSCKRLWTGCVITVAGEVLPCCYDKSAQYSFGNLSVTSLRDIYWGEKAQRFREQVIKHPASIDICRNCAQ
ncbi:MAG: SPASM domain-containing protein [Paludibacteraceae bacterium]|nr:SPASM domain-containing protein [Paludibacteraceae bacterium]